MQPLAGVVASFVLALAFPLAALAQDGPCREDAARLCADASGPGALRSCLMDKRGELSERCRARIDRAGEGQRGRLEACRADLERLCAGVAPGGGALRRCLFEHRDALSQECRAQLGAPRADPAD